LGTLNAEERITVFSAFWRRFSANRRDEAEKTANKPAASSEKRNSEFPHTFPSSFRLGRFQFGVYACFTTSSLPCSYCVLVSNSASTLQLPDRLCRSFKSAVAHINRRTDKKIPIDRNPPILVDPIIGLNPILEKSHGHSSRAHTVKYVVWQRQIESILG
jgi:hypothetical protein